LRRALVDGFGRRPRQAGHLPWRRRIFAPARKWSGASSWARPGPPGTRRGRRLHSGAGAFSGGFESTPSAYLFRVVGISSFGFQEYDARLAFIPLEDAKRLGNARQSIFGVEMRFTDPMLALRVEEAVEARLGPTGASSTGRP
jgi:hypothetical protein